ncbi:SRPBCC domain-containing protein [Streptomyces sp. DSM 44917]|uniref:SRPBCC domain-containing protein n=1 Tax=Streptomyces boetiae TaxID=3075541 RepID=A0ABU2L435_9ACTN|nr:SRPBCC domain-containing protein [Streptomyces sp. DSM 44917]MDT0306325.1 SRPBCC domain-containing protein [Streptomyces sp. DSM 44917]
MTANDTAQAPSYTLTRELEAPVAAVWDAWTEREHFVEWFGVIPETVELDVRPGGSWSSTIVTPVGDFPMSGGYAEVVPRRRLVTTMNVGRPEPAVMEMDLTPLGEGRTRIVLSQECDSEEERDQAREGSTMLLDALTAYLAR